jgi:ketopantoate reductase
MTGPAVVVGLGQLGGVFSHALLRAGYVVVPVLRGQDLGGAHAVGEPEMVVIAVGEGDLDRVLERVPVSLRDRVVLLQNELLPETWERAGLVAPTVAVVWFEKKRGIDVHVLRPTLLHGPHAGALERALSGLDISSRVLAGPEALTHALVCKNVYIWTTNIAGLAVGGTVGELIDQHRALALDVAHDAIAVQLAMAGRWLSASQRATLHQEMRDDFLAAAAADPAHKCMGRTAPARLARALQHAEALGVDVPALRRVEAAMGTDARRADPS